ncbi:MAG: VWA domain-containing protein [Microcoleus sp. PH2017_10_PVI_O_A]|uniref:VWA domain-containing protein n=1 Tax=unclassified Microcoleus TaxID=2642155 RepID=UPI001D5B03F8|nr:MULTISPECIES: VWA domain-containing protein [unclassified Microcoleus]TAE81451.1 MAG: VWA domain-containing protein [Oscillatoriales cyanobacterium]MCC3407150.1 VWA domain-containing protein [Microcoleus sp. PH2017_10_PVI_O_A]MCC3461253.1 VWA domain-containing protein [Microcoleus sp. PH2017_11_PCY_U_A]MCC3479680.1 VWA domain-containing protein [Microcoleus sp. PH2017_12_PCY_D_A]MCC3560662.1 VWA domain-containing protein [Microcoleus sp. PH2017_27_LUM_O_A]
MSDGQSVKYAVDLVMCIDGTGSMGHLIEEVKSLALKFYDELEAEMKVQSKKVEQLRARVIVFRDYWADSADKVMQCSEFFDLRSQSSDFANFVSPIEADGGGDEPENGLEAVGLALKSNWEKGDFSKQRYVVVLFTDASAHSLDKGPKPSHYPNDIPKTFNDLTDYWHEMPTPVKRLLLFAPDAEPWTMMGSWENTIHYVSEAGRGLEKTEMKEILNAIAKSI